MISKSFEIESNPSLLKKSKLYLFFGENLGLKNDLKKIIKEQNKEFSIQNVFQNDILSNKDAFFDEIFNGSLFEEKKIFFINQASDKIFDVIKELELKLDNQEIYLFSEILDKKSKLRGFFEKSKIYISIACYPDNEITIKKIIQNALKGYKGLTLENINLIAENCNLDRDKLRNELSKITSFFSNKSIDKERLDLLLNIRTNENFDSLKDYALNGNKKKTNSLIRDTYIDAEKNILYLNMINRRLTRISEVNENAITTDIETAISKLRPPVFWKEKAHFVSQTKKWNKEKIKNVLKQTYNLELKLKSNSLINSQILIKKLLIDICVLANS